MFTKQRLLAILLGATVACARPKEAEDTPLAAFRRWEVATETKDVEAYFEAIVPPNRVEFLMNIVNTWRAGDWQSSNPDLHERLGVLLRKYRLDSLAFPLDFNGRAHLDTIAPLPAVLAEIAGALGGEGPRGVPLWDLMPQPVSLGEVGAVDTYDSAPATATFRAFDVDSMAPRERTDQIRFFRGKDGRWRVSPPF